MNNKVKTQTEDIKNYIETHKNGLTSLQAIRQFGATRLPDVIYRLKRPPYNMPIVTSMKTVDNRYGGKSRVACYKLGD